MIPLKEIFEKSSELFKAFPEIGKFRDEDGPFLRLKDEDGITYDIREKEMQATGPSTKEHIQGEALEVAHVLLKSLGRSQEEPRLANIEYTCEKSQSFKVPDLFSKDMQKIGKKLKFLNPCTIFLFPKDKAQICIRHVNPVDLKAGKITISTENLELASKLIFAIESQLKRGDKV